ncbi:extracellular nuclease [Cyanobium sp. Copco_Reservoir_LC18]|uniref:hypothetical protein n=1 Tax=Cyanobium sp. Copco_Reservoir_LC18 TaxID=1328305 RepID=UPI00135CED0D|nr:hypothetical protein [Cyanobium sp. Copco_Reservoir_LC18]KAF0652348.1 extracellular nuclease [Cyanobium sp. Copco_Reservoir_LC18]
MASTRFRVERETDLQRLLALGRRLNSLASSDGNRHGSFDLPDTGHRPLGTNPFGLGDTFGGGDRDVDDHVIGFTFSQIV